MVVFLSDEVEGVDDDVDGLLLIVVAMMTRGTMK